MEGGDAEQEKGLRRKRERGGTIGRKGRNTEKKSEEMRKQRGLLGEQ